MNEKQKAKARELVKTILEKKKKQKAKKPKYTEPRYDEVYFRGVEWLDSL